MSECPLPTHPRTGLRAVGIIGGRPVWPILGASEDDTSTDSGGDAPATGAATQDDTDWRAETAKWQTLSRKNEERARANAAAAKELQTIKDGAASEVDKAVKSARAETEQAVTARFTRRLVGLSIKAAAGGRYQTPADAEYQLRDEVDTFLTADGEVDEKAVAAAVDRVLKEKPYLGVKTDTQPPDFDGGQRTGTGQSGSTDMNNFLRQLGGRRR